MGAFWGGGSANIFFAPTLWKDRSVRHIILYYQLLCLSILKVPPLPCLPFHCFLWGTWCWSHCCTFLRHLSFLWRQCSSVFPQWSQYHYAESRCLSYFFCLGLSIIPESKDSKLSAIVKNSQTFSCGKSPFSCSLHCSCGSFMRSMLDPLVYPPCLFIPAFSPSFCFSVLCSGKLFNSNSINSLSNSFFRYVKSI